MVLYFSDYAQNQTYHTLSMRRVTLCLYLDNIMLHKFSCCSILALSSLHDLARGGPFAYYTRQNRPELALSAPPNSDAKKRSCVQNLFTPGRKLFKYHSSYL
jgi:hypothetical protein